MEEELENPYLTAFYEHLHANPGKHNPHALPLQLYFAQQRAQREQASPYFNGFQILDRCLLEYYHIFVKNLVNIGMINENEFGVYMKVYSAFPHSLKHPNVIVLLKSDVSTNYERIQRRARNCESATIDLSYLNSLKVQYEHYERILENEHPDIKLIQINTDELNPEDVFEIVIRQLSELTK